MSRNPFHYGTPVSGPQFAGREMELEALTSRMSDGINIVLSSPRRYGKTSLLVKATGILEAQGAAVVSVNILACRDLATLGARLANGTYRAPAGRWHRLAQAAAEFVRRMRVSPTVTFDGDTPTFSFAAELAATDADRVISDVYALLAEMSQAHPAVLVLDEFQAITDLGAHLPDLFKALADEHPTVSLVLAGSKQHLMDELIAHRGAPLFGLAERIALDVIPTQVMHTYLTDRAAASGKRMSDRAAERLIGLSGPVPNDIQHLAYETWNLAARTITVADVEEGLARSVAHEASSHADRFEGLSPGQRRVVAALASTPVDEPFGSAFARSVGLAGSSSVIKAMDALTGAELVTKRAGLYQVSDPFFRAWLVATT